MADGYYLFFDSIINISNIKNKIVNDFKNNNVQK